MCPAPAPDAAARPVRPTLDPAAILARLNEPQREAVAHLDRAAADPGRGGSGKTRVLAHRSLPRGHRLQAVADRGRHVHQQGRQRDARADRRADRRGAPRARRRSAPSTPSARGSCAATARSSACSRSFTIYDRADQVALIEAVLRAPRPRREALRPGGHAGLDRAAQGRAGRSRHRRASRRPTSTTRRPHGSTRATSAAAPRTTRSTSTTC